MSEPLGEGSVRAQAAQALIALATEAAAAWTDPQFVRRERHGDPTIMPELRARACARVGANAAVVEALLRQDADLLRLWDLTIAQARATTAESGGRLRAIVIMAACAVALCLVAWLVFSYYQGEAASHRPAPHAEQPAP